MPNFERLKAHLEVIEEVFSKYREARLRFNPEKANFGCKSIVLLGLELSEAGCRVNPPQFELIGTWKRPKDIKSLRKFLGCQRILNPL